MKYYTKETQAPRLVIEYDDYTESPRTWDNLGYFLSLEKQYQSPDGTDNSLYHIMNSTQHEARNDEHHMELIKEQSPQSIAYIVPITRYEHSGIVYKIGVLQGFDYSHCGFYIITSDQLKEYNIKPANTKEINRIVQSELDIYNQYVNGEVYCFILYDENGEHEDSCGGFYDIEGIKDHLPEDWKNEDLEQYKKNI